MIAGTVVNYLHFGRKLGLTADHVSRIEKNMKMRGETECCELIVYQLLDEAEKKFENLHTPDMLIKALKAIGRNDTAKKIQNMLQ